MNELKALTFLQFWDLRFEDQPMGMMKYFLLVSQPFTPELITKYFEGWEQPDEYDYDFRYGIYSFYIADGDDYCTIFGKYDTNTTTPIPQTLDDFIRDCQRAGIELYFKKQEANNE